LFGAIASTATRCIPPADVECTGPSTCKGSDAIRCPKGGANAQLGTVQSCPGGTTCGLVLASDEERTNLDLAEDLAPQCVVDGSTDCGGAHVAGDAFCEENRPTICVARVDGSLARALVANPCPGNTECLIQSPEAGGDVVVCVELPQTHCEGQEIYQGTCDGNIRRYCAYQGVSAWAREDCGARFCDPDGGPCLYEAP